MNNTNHSGKGRLPRIDDIIRGSIVIMERTCGKKNCRCQRGHKHKSLYISQYHKGSPRMIYIPKANEEKVLRLVKNYQLLKSAIHTASELNLYRFTAGSKRGKV